MTEVHGRSVGSVNCVCSMARCSRKTRVEQPSVRLRSDLDEESVGSAGAGFAPSRARISRAKPADQNDLTESLLVVGRPLAPERITDELHPHRDGRSFS